MPAISAPAKVLVTGSTGFLGVSVIKTLLEQGYNVLAAVRSLDKSTYLQNLFKEYGDRLAFTVVEDIQKDGAFDEAVKFVDAVEHLASPFHTRADDPQEIIGPAVQGTIGILQSIKNHGPNVKRVVITSSTMSVIHDKPGPISDVVYDETDWNVDSLREVEEKGKAADGMHKYAASKTLAEQAAWQFVESYKHQISFDLVTVCPPVIWGPVLQDVKSADALNTSVAVFRMVARSPLPRERLIALSVSGNWADSRDVSLVHVLALSNPAAGSQRYLVGGSSVTLQDVLDAIHSTGDYPDVLTGFPGAAEAIPRPTYSTAKAEKDFGIKFKTLEETLPAMYKSLQERGLY